MRDEISLSADLAALKCDNPYFHDTCLFHACKFDILNLYPSIIGFGEKKWQNNLSKSYYTKYY